MPLIERMQKHFLPALENRMIVGDRTPQGDTR
jgi:hypothetical protein